MLSFDPELSLFWISFANFMRGVPRNWTNLQTQPKAAFGKSPNKFQFRKHRCRVFDRSEHKWFLHWCRCWPRWLTFRTIWVHTWNEAKMSRNILELKISKIVLTVWSLIETFLEPSLTNKPDRRCLAERLVTEAIQCQLHTRKINGTASKKKVKCKNNQKKKNLLQDVVIVDQGQKSIRKIRGECNEWFQHAVDHFGPYDTRQFLN